MDAVINLVGPVVVVMAILSFFGLRRGAPDGGGGARNRYITRCFPASVSHLRAGKSFLSKWFSVARSAVVSPVDLRI